MAGADLNGNRWVYRKRSRVAAGSATSSTLALSLLRSSGKPLPPLACLSGAALDDILDDHSKTIAPFLPTSDA